jgi:hypothetical protein
MALVDTADEKDGAASPGQTGHVQRRHLGCTIVTAEVPMANGRYPESNVAPLDPPRGAYDDDRGHPPDGAPFRGGAFSHLGRGMREYERRYAGDRDLGASLHEPARDPSLVESAAAREDRLAREAHRAVNRGPRGYRRSDARIHEDICEALTRDPDVDAGDIEVVVQNGDVTLGGTVEERRWKRQAEAIAEGVRGVNDIFNLIRVRRTDAEQRRAGLPPGTP